ncbi:MAG: hypothetical protein CML68_13890 [Rhodobacteraceae bacterium]|nr:hypothetical protein [Paracoccaceae bacterium]
MTAPCEFRTLVLDRRIEAAPERVFALMTDPDARRTWGAPGEGIVIEIDQCDVRDGGREVARCGPRDAPDFSAVSDFHRVEAPRLIVLSETLTVGGNVLSVSLATQELSAEGSGCQLKVTLQIVSLTGPETFDGYAEGWTGALDNLVRMAEAETVQ